MSEAAKFTNRFQIERGDLLTRIEFCEARGKETLEVATLVMLNSDADQLAPLLEKLKAQHEAQGAVKQ